MCLSWHAYTIRASGKFQSHCQRVKELGSSSSTSTWSPWSGNRDLPLPCSPSYTREALIKDLDESCSGKGASSFRPVSTELGGSGHLDPAELRWHFTCTPVTCSAVSQC